MEFASWRKRRLSAEVRRMNRLPRFPEREARAYTTQYVCWHGIFDATPPAAQIIVIARPARGCDRDDLTKGGNPRIGLISAML